MSDKGELDALFADEEVAFRLADENIAKHLNKVRQAIKLNRGYLRQARNDRTQKGRKKKAIAKPIINRW